MTKEELTQEAIKYAVDYPTSYGKGYKHKDLRIAYLAGAEPREKQITDLEKKNAELKSIADFQTSSNMDRYFKLKRSKEQIAEAKEIIREFVKWANWQGSGCPSFKSIQDKAEAFLNSEVEK